MKNFKRDGRPGKKKFSGGRSAWKSGSYGRDRESRGDFHDAMCSICGDACQVPFRPDGRKPVKCRNCFKKDGAQGRFMRDNSGRKSFGRFDRDDRGPQADTRKIEARLEAIEDKLDLLIEALSQEE